MFFEYINNQQQNNPAPNLQCWSNTTALGVQWSVFLGDAYSVLKTLPSNTFNCVVTSPPYYWLRDYKTQDQIGLEERVEDYIEAISRVMDEVYRVLKTDGILFLNLGDTYYSGKGKSHGVDEKNKARRFGLRAVDKSGGLGIGLQPKTIIGIPWRVAIRMSGRNWVLRSPIIWHRKNSLPEAVVDRPRRSYEYIFMFVKSRNYYFNRLALKNRQEEDMWTIVTRPKSTPGIQTAPFPDELVQRCLDVGCPTNGTVLDPFAGSGTTLRVALRTGRSSVGIDINPTFCQYMVNQLTGTWT